jgi:hypothetical protein
MENVPETKDFRKYRKGEDLDGIENKLALGENSRNYGNVRGFRPERRDKIYGSRVHSAGGNKK